MMLRAIILIILSIFVRVAFADNELRDLPGWERKIITNGKVQLEVFQKGQGLAVIMHPSLGRAAQDFEELGNAVTAAGYRVVLVNPRGIGGSEGPMDKVSLHELGADLWLVADELNIRQAVILGQIYGNRVVRVAASDRNDRVKGLILLGAGGDVRMETGTQAEFRKVFNANESMERRFQAMSSIFFAPGNDASAWRNGWFLATAHAQIAAMRNTDMRASYFGGTAPALVVQGLNDKIALPLNAWNFVNARPNSRLVALPNTGHAMLPEQPAAIADAVLSFLKSIR